MGYTCIPQKTHESQKITDKLETLPPWKEQQVFSVTDQIDIANT